jgi:HTH-type transcriptional regulator / antitoxin HipB
METIYSLPESSLQGWEVTEIKDTRFLHQFIGVIIIITALNFRCFLYSNLILITALLFLPFFYHVIVLSKNAIKRTQKSCIFTISIYSRTLMALMIAIIISKPIESAIFSNQITKETSINNLRGESVFEAPEILDGLSQKRSIIRQIQNSILFNTNQSSRGHNMIQNEHQYKISYGKIKEIEQFLDELYKEKNSLHPRQFKMRENGLQGMLSEIQEEIKEYDALKEKPITIEIQSFAEIPIALIKARIALGMTQKDLAEKLGMKEQQIQRYESNQYGSAGFHRLTEVAEALEVTLNSSLLTLRN